VRGALLAGSAGRGDADFYSDVDLLIYVDELPPEGTLERIRAALGGVDPEPKERFDWACGEVFFVEDVRTEVNFLTVERLEWRLVQLHERPEEIEPPLQKVFGGIADGLPLYGEEEVATWQARARDYPEGLRRVLIERHWKFLALWYYREVFAARDAELWRLDALLDAAFNLLYVLAALNRVYFERVELKRTRALVAKLSVAPPRLADRLESLFRLDAESAATELAQLVEETRALVSAELPKLELKLEFPPAERQRPWRSQAPPPPPSGGSPRRGRGP
jgi:predicted nucleotidyltransferase